MNHDLLLSSGEEVAVKELWHRFFTFLLNDSSISNIKTIFAHNLGSFDGYFIYKGLLEYINSTSSISLEDISTIIDPSNNLILIKIGKVTLKDSYRIFPVSLNELCNIFGVPGKIQAYDPSFNEVGVLANQTRLLELIEYNRGDCVSLAVRHECYRRVSVLV